jgi:hypothetical protein
VPLKIYYRSKDDEKPGAKRDADEIEWMMSDEELDAAVAAEDELADEEFEDDSVD